MESLAGDDDRLRTVFNVLDENSTGYISVDRFIEVAAQQIVDSGSDSSGEQAITKIIDVLDPTGIGKINFTQFQEGIARFLEIQSPPTPNSAKFDRVRFPSATSTVDSGFAQQSLDNDLIQFDANSNQVTDGYLSNDCVDGLVQQRPAYTDQITTLNPFADFSEHQLSSSYQHHPQQQQQQLLSFDDDIDSGFGSKISDHYEPNQFSGFGEEQNIEIFSEESTSSDMNDLESSSPLARPSHLASSSSRSGRQLTPSAVARQLYRSGNSTLPPPQAPDTSRRSSLSDVYDDIDENFTELNDKVKQLEEQVRQLTEAQESNVRKQDKMKEENGQLIERVHVLEEQLRDVEGRAVEQLEEERKRHKELMSRSEKEKSREIEILSHSLQHIEQEYTSLKDEAPALRGENERLRKETSKQENEIDRLNQQLTVVTQEHKSLQDHFQLEQSKVSKERTVHAQLVDELSKELDSLRSFRAQQLAKASPILDKDRLSRNEKQILEEQIHHFKKENATLREQVDELQAQLLHKHIEEGQQLLQSSSMVSSLAAEIEDVSRDEFHSNYQTEAISRADSQEQLKELITKEREANAKLRDYIERITLRILEKNPSILEVGAK